MTEVDFYELTRPVQDSLLDSLHSRYAPYPTAVRLGARPKVLMWLGVSAVALVALALLAGVGYGSVDSSLSIHATWLIVVYCLLAVTCALAFLEALAFRGREGSLPYVAGIYLFPACVIDAREHTLRSHPLEDMSSVAVEGRNLVLKVGSASFSFPLADAAAADEAKVAVEAARARLASPLGDEERRTMDPLVPPSAANPLASDVPLARTTPSWEQRRHVSGAVAGCIIGVGLFFTRNAMSDSRMLAWARAHDDVPSYESYLARGRSNRDLVSQVLLPRAALKAAVAKGSVEAIDTFLHDHPKTGIQTEIDAARRTALLAEFEKARAAGTFAALLGYADHYPDHPAGAEFVKAEHALYTKALDRYKKGVVEGMGDAVSRLVASAERAGPRKAEGGYRGLTVAVRFRRLPSKDMDRADDLVRKNPMFNGVPSLPSRYLDAKRFEPHERTTATAIAKALTASFDPEIVSFEAGPPLEGSDADVAALKVPTVVVSYRPETSGAAYASKAPHGIFLGLIFFFNAELAIPGDAHPQHTKLTLTERIPIDTVKKDVGGAPLGTLEAAVYEEMTRDAFANFRDKYVATWFGEGKTKK